MLQFSSYTVRIAEKLVLALLDDSQIDPRRFPDVYKLSWTDPSGTQLFKTCMYCEMEHMPMSKGRYANGTSVSHGMCQRHANKQAKDWGLKTNIQGSAVDWDEVAKSGGRFPSENQAASPAKATFWVTSGSGE